MEDGKNIKYPELNAVYMCRILTAVNSNVHLTNLFFNDRNIKFCCSCSVCVSWHTVMNLSFILEMRYESTIHFYSALRLILLTHLCLGKFQCNVLPIRNAMFSITIGHNEWLKLKRKDYVTPASQTILNIIYIMRILPTETSFTYIL